MLGEKIKIGDKMSNRLQWKNVFMKNNIPRNKNRICGQIEQFITFIIRGVTEEYCWSSTKREFVAMTGKGGCIT